VLYAGSRASTGYLRLSGRLRRAVTDPCCTGDLSYLLLQINVICLLLALIGSTAIVKHPAWFGGTPTSAALMIAER
jgi:hypothetical protein